MLVMDSPMPGNPLNSLIILWLSDEFRYQNKKTDYIILDESKHYKFYNATGSPSLNKSRLHSTVA